MATDIIGPEGEESLDLNKLSREIEGKQFHARRSVKVEIVNNTDVTLKLKSYKLHRSHGIWTIPVPQFIKPQSTVLFGTEIPSRTFLRLHQAKVVYVLEDEIFGDQPFKFKWNNHLFSHFAHSHVPIYFQVTHHSTWNRHSIVTFTIDQKEIESIPLKDRIKHLSGVSYFNEKELEQLFARLHETSGPYITKEEFLKRFPELADDEASDAAYHLFRPDKNRIVHIEDFLKVVSILARGRIEDKIKLAYQVFDLDANGFVERDEVLYIAKSVSRIMQQMGYEKTTFGDPESVVDGIFAKFSADGNTAVYEEGISKEAFLARAASESDLAQCFGLFPFFTEKIVRPMERLLETLKPHTEMTGYLVGRTSLTKMPKVYHVVLRRGFMAWYHIHVLEGDPVVVYDLSFASVKPRRRTGFAVNIGTKVLLLKAATVAEQHTWISALRENTKGIWRLNSFAPVRKGCSSKWLVNGKEYFEELMPVLLKAKKQILIGGWYLSPSLYLKRNPPQEDSRLDLILKKKAEEGVMIRIFIWSGNQLAYNLQAKNVRDYMNALHPNVRCLTHPHIFPMMWSHHQKFVVIDEDIAFVGGIDLAFNRYDDSNYNLTDPDNQVFPGRDYTNFSKYSESNELPTEPPANSVDRTKYPRTPWHDIACVLDGLAARDVAFNFIQKWNNVMHSINKKEQQFLVPKSINEPSKIYLDKNRCYPNLTLQLLRSGCDWSFGIPEVERSIEKAYYYLIKLSQHFLYFENQYFISGVDQPLPKNRLLKALYERIKLAIEEKQQFRCVIVLPIHPAGDPKGVSIRYIMKYTYETINRKGSLMQRLEEEFPDVDLSQYINFYALRNWAILNGTPVTEQIYIHAKLAIMDDRAVVIGSSNINDRSMVGSHDSEIGIAIQTPQGEFIPGSMGGKPFMVAKYAHDLRCRLWKDHLGLSSEDTSVDDPILTAHDLLRRTAASNTKIYNQVFPCLPDKISCLADYKDEIDNYGDIELLKQVKGFLVEFPLYFFMKDKLPPNPGSTIFL